MGPLKGLKVVEMSAIGPVPLAGMLLADMGADVVVVDRSDASGILPGDIARRGKRAIAVDLKSAEVVATIKHLIDHADIVIEGFRPGVMERLGLGPEQFKSSNRKLIYGRMTGWGQTGPLAQTAAHDINYIALSGALHAIGRGDSAPVPPLNLVGDSGGGTMFLMMGILAALHESKSSGQGQIVDAAITEGSANLMTLFYSLHNIGAWKPERGSNMLDSGSHFYDTYETSDGKYISLGSIEPHFYALMKEKMGLAEIDFADQNNPLKWPALKLKMAKVVKTKSRDQWCEIMEGTDVCFAPVLDYLEASEHAHMKARKAFLEIDGKLQPAPSPRFSRTPSEAGGSFKKDSDVSEIMQDWGVD